MGHTDAVVVLTTLANTDEAVKFVRALLDRRLVACGTILPAARSLYRWEDKLADETEVVVMLKTRSGAIHDERVLLGEKAQQQVLCADVLVITAMCLFARLDQGAAHAVCEIVARQKTLLVVGLNFRRRWEVASITIRQLPLAPGKSH